MRARICLLALAGLLVRSVGAIEGGDTADKGGADKAPRGEGGAGGGEGKKYEPRVIGDREFTLEEIHRYNGKNPGEPIYVALRGSVFDVTSGAERFYGPGKSYHKFAGRDITRNTAMFSTKEKDLDRTDYPEEKQKAVDKSYDRTYVRKYPIVGTLKPYTYEIPPDEEEEGDPRGKGGGEFPEQVPGARWDAKAQRFVYPKEVLEAGKGGGGGGGGWLSWAVNAASEAIVWLVGGGGGKEL